MRRCGLTCHHKSWNIVCERGGGSKAQPAQIIPAPTPPSVSETAKQSTEAQLQYNPQLAAQSVQLQGQYGPQLAQQQYNLQAQYAPLYRALVEQQFPQISTLAAQTQQGLASPTGLSAQQQAAQDQARQQATTQVSSQYADVLGPRAIQQFQSPIGLTPEQQSAQDAIRQRALDASARGERTRANLGGTLYGGNSALNESQARNELLQGFANEDISLQQQQRQASLQQLLAAQGVQGGVESQRQQFGLQNIGLQQQQRQQQMQELLSLFQLAGFNVQQPAVQQFGSAPSASGDSLYNALVQNSGNFGIIPGQQGSPSPAWGLGGSAIGAAGMVGAAALL